MSTSCMRAARNRNTLGSIAGRHTQASFHSPAGHALKARAKSISRHCRGWVTKNFREVYYVFFVKIVENAQAVEWRCLYYIDGDSI
jgi:hypothetical protein